MRVVSLPLDCAEKLRACAEVRRHGLFILQALIISRVFKERDRIEVEDIRALNDFEY